MGDRCYLSVTYSKADEASFKACEDLGIDPNTRWANYDEDTNSYTASWGEDECSPGHLLPSVEEVGRPFLGWHGAGCSYGPYLFVFDGQTFFEWESDWENGSPTATVNPDGEIPPYQLDHIMEYYQAVEWVEFYFKIQAERHNKNGG